MQGASPHACALTVPPSACQPLASTRGSRRLAEAMRVVWLVSERTRPTRTDAHGARRGKQAPVYAGAWRAKHHCHDHHARGAGGAGSVPRRALGGAQADAAAAARGVQAARLLVLPRHVERYRPTREGQMYIRIVEHQHQYTVRSRTRWVSEALQLQRSWLRCWLLVHLAHRRYQRGRSRRHRGSR